MSLKKNKRHREKKLLLRIDPFFELSCINKIILLIQSLINIIKCHKLQTTSQFSFAINMVIKCKLNLI